MHRAGLGDMRVKVFLLAGQIVLKRKHQFHRHYPPRRAAKPRGSFIT